MRRRLLVLDAYAPEGREALRSAGGTEAGALYAEMLSGLAPDAEIEVAYPADPDPALPSPADFDGITWTGSSLTIHDEDDPRVLAINQLDGVFSASPALSGRDLFLRSDRSLYRLASEPATAVDEITAAPPSTR